MIDQKKHRYQSEALSLLTLKLVLTEAKRESPPQARKEEQWDEELALKLIADMKKKYRKAMSLRGAFVPGTARQGRCATKKSPLSQKIASSLRARNDMKVEP